MSKDGFTNPIAAASTGRVPKQGCKSNRKKAIEEKSTESQLESTESQLRRVKLVLMHSLDYHDFFKGLKVQAENSQPLNTDDLDRKMQTNGLAPEKAKLIYQDIFRTVLPKFVSDYYGTNDSDRVGRQALEFLADKGGIEHETAAASIDEAYRNILLERYKVILGQAATRGINFLECPSGPRDKKDYLVDICKHLGWDLEKTWERVLTFVRNSRAVRFIPGVGEFGVGDSPD